ncbi:MAG TPA: ATP-binding protein [Candidatus Acidoferrales bacterium]|jgi:serine/threonine-protein kinase RsbW|nr:ATP-binding protein [Candidatus Acidoferrales bacterium]
MPNSANRIEVTMETLLDSVTLAEGITERVARAAGFNDDDCLKIGMSVREGVINAFRYGNEEQRHKKIQLNFEVTGNKFVVHIVDEGRGFNLHEIPDPLAEENLLKTSGRGIFLMRTFMDEFEVRRTPEGGAELVMSKKLHEPHPAPHLQDQ